MSLSELLLTLMVALIVFGPKQLPMAATHLGKLLQRVNQFKRELGIYWQQQLDQEQLQINQQKAEQADKWYQDKLPPLQ